jgi:hypothetical protein
LKRLTDAYEFNRSSACGALNPGNNNLFLIVLNETKQGAQHICAGLLAKIGL